jgi:uncharacterized repeat protein (TIGR01451 family)
MPRQKAPTVLIALSLILTSCLSHTPPPVIRTATPSPASAQATPVIVTPLTISELQAGASGNDELEFVELYNATPAALHLEGYRLIYRTAAGQGDTPLFVWTGPAIIPPHGHYLLVRTGQEDTLGTIADATFNQPLHVAGGGLALVGPRGDRVDSVGWGNAPSGYVEGAVAPTPENDVSIERLPGGESGNGTDTENNKADFVINPQPHPQNTSSLPTPVEKERFLISLAAPTTVEPETQFNYELYVTNQTDTTTHEVVLTLNVPISLTIAGASDGGIVNDNLVRWVLAEMADGDVISRRVTVETPSTYTVLTAREYSVQAADWPKLTGGPPVRTRVEGGIIPIVSARSLVGTRVTVEGIVTMYTDVSPAGPNNAVFYLQDETGGIKTSCLDCRLLPSSLNLGDRVRVTGEVDMIHHSVQIVSAANSDEIVLLSTEEPVRPREIALSQVTSDPTFAGWLIAVTGQVIRVEGSTYGYEIDLADDQGNVLLVYTDRSREMQRSLEQVAVGHQYTIVGISEVFDNSPQLKPRIPADIVEIHPPTLMIEAFAPHNVLPGETLVYTLTVSNHTNADFSDVTITSTLPSENAVLAAIDDEGNMEGNGLFWTIPTLAAHTSHSARFSAAVLTNTGTIVLERYAAWANEWPLHESGLPLVTFIGASVPVYAIQGPGLISPYTSETVDTEGIVTGVFPQLEGFWIQGALPDDKPITSEGLFVRSGENPVEVEASDLIRVRGQVHERFGQTELHISSADDVIVVDSDLPLPTPIELDPPLESESSTTYYEPLEGMLVSVTEPAIAIAPTSAYGEYVLVRSEHQIDRVFPGEETGLLITVDDGALVRHSDASALPYVVRTGDRVSNLVGPLAASFDDYVIEPIEPPAIEGQIKEEIRQLPQPGPSEFSIATFDIESVSIDREPGRSGDPGDSRDHHSRDRDMRRRDQIVSTIAALGMPTVIGFQGVESLDVLESIALHPDLAIYDYQAILTQVPVSPDGSVAFLTHGDRITVTGVKQYQTPEGLFSHPPLMITMTVDTAAPDAATVYAVVNHFTSPDIGGPLAQSLRIKEAKWNALLVDRVLESNPEALLVVLGNLNAHYDSVLLRTLTEDESSARRLLNTAQALSPGDRYSAITGGVSQLLDHILVTPELAVRQVRVDVLHINADHPPADPDQTNLYHNSSHDPVVAYFDLGS